MSDFQLSMIVTCVLGAMYPFVLYPCILLVLPRFVGRRSPQVGSRASLPAFTVIIPAHNEEKVISRKLDNTLLAAGATHVPFQIIVAADGCSDRTCDIVRGYSAVELVEVRERGGIVGAFKAALGTARHDIVFFSDADIEIDEHTFAVMLRHFSDPSVGGVCGSTRMKVVHGSGLEAEQMNVTYRRWIRHRQSLVHSSIGADGANWALRRKFVQFPERQLAEDLVMPLEVIHAGYRFLYEPLGGAVETSPLSVHDEYHRKVRTIAGGIQAALYCRWMFTPRFAATGFHFVSWKLSKYAVPGWAIIGYVTALTIPALSQVALLMGMATVGFALTAGMLRNTNRGILKWMVTPGYCLVAAATPFAAVTTLLRRRGNLNWRMAAR